MNHESIYIDVHETGNESEILLREKFKEQLLALIKAHKDVLVLREFLLELMDFVAGFCNSRLSIF